MRDPINVDGLHKNRGKGTRFRRVHKTGKGSKKIWMAARHIYIYNIIILATVTDRSMIEFTLLAFFELLAKLQRRQSPSYSSPLFHYYRRWATVAFLRVGGASGASNLVWLRKDRGLKTRGSARLSRTKVTGAKGIWRSRPKMPDLTVR